MKARLLLSLLLSLCISDLWAFDSTFSLKNKDGASISYRILSKSDCEVSSVYIRDLSMVNSLYLPDSVEFEGNKFVVSSIGKSAMSSYSEHSATFEKIRFPEHLRIIKEKAFYKVGVTGTIEFPEELEVIESRAFEGCFLYQLVFPNSVTSIGDYAFKNCNYLRSVKLSSALISLGSYAFSNCAIEEIIIPEGITSIEKYTFENNELKVVSIPSSVISIGEEAFAYNRIEELNLPCNLCKIGNLAFTRNIFSTVLIPNSVKEIIGNPFQGCRSLVDIKVEEENTAYYSKDNSIFSKDGTAIIAYPSGKVGEYSIPEGILTIGEAFAESSLSTITIPRSISSIEDNAFSASDISSIEIPSWIQNIGMHSFLCCGLLKKISISCDVGIEAFRGCSNLSEITICGDISIGRDAFYGCSEVKDLYLTGIPTGASPFWGDVIPITLHVPLGTKSIYESDYYWSRYWEIVEFEEETGIDHLQDMNSSQSVYDLNGLIHTDKSNRFRIIQKSNGNNQKIYVSN